MNLRKKKELASRTFKVGKERIIFVQSRINEIKEAITKQDMRDLLVDGAIIIREMTGRKKVVKVNRRSVGNVRKKVNVRKQKYVIMTRKLRGYVKKMETAGNLTRDEVKSIRKKIRNKGFKSQANLKEHIGEIRK
jgi:large subunit ribosomal protein L19e